MKKFLSAGLMAASLIATSHSALADGREPGSILLFPVVDTCPGAVTLITVTNVSKVDSVWIEYHYIDGTDCEKHDVTELLSPRDTLTVVSEAHSPARESLGYLYVFAKDGQFGVPMSFNHLIGQASTVDGVLSIQHSYNPYTYEAIGAQFSLTDIDGDGERDLNGVEYEPVADILLHPRFLAQDDSDRYPGVFGLNSQLVLIDLTGGRFWETEVEFFIYNDNEQRFSATFVFNCWTRVPLLEISEAFGQGFLERTNHDEREIVGFPDLESGWFEIDGINTHNSGNDIRDPAILSLLIEQVGAFSGADLPFQEGTQDNGDLRPHGEG